jgi:ribosomal protein S13
MTLEKIDRAWLLRSALRILAGTNFRIAPAWVAVMDLCGVGSTSAREICREQGLDPEKKLSEHFQ